MFKETVVFVNLGILAMGIACLFCPNLLIMVDTILKKIFIRRTDSFPLDKKVAITRLAGLSFLILSFFIYMNILSGK